MGLAEQGNNSRPSVLLVTARLLAYLVIVFIGFVVVMSIMVAVSYSMEFHGPGVNIGPGISIPLWEVALSEILAAAMAVLVTLGFVAYVDRRPVRTLGLSFDRAWLRDLFLGVVIRFGMIGLMFTILKAASWTTVKGVYSPFSSASAIIMLLESILFMIGVAVAEEVIMRGYVLQSLRIVSSPVAALVVSSVLFGLVHTMNPGSSIRGIIGTAAAGSLLGYGYLATGRLWLPIGIHFAWNFAEGTIFGFAVSGADLPSIIRQSVSGPTIWTGGRFGPEAGILTPIVLVAGALVIRQLFRNGINRPKMESVELSVHGSEDAG